MSGKSAEDETRWSSLFLRKTGNRLSFIFLWSSGFGCGLKVQREVENTKQSDNAILSSK